MSKYTGLPNSVLTTFISVILALLSFIGIASFFFSLLGQDREGLEQHNRRQSFRTVAVLIKWAFLPTFLEGLHP